MRYCRMIRLGFLAVCVLILGCDKIDEAQRQVDEAVRIVDRGIEQIHEDSTRWQAVLQDVAKNLPQEIQSIIRIEVNDLAQRSIATVGVEFRCNVDFLSGRAIVRLQRIKTLLLNSTPPVIGPGFCQVTPASINLNLDPERRAEIAIDGYDLDALDVKSRPMRVILESSDGVTRIDFPESRLGRTTHYHMVLNVHGPDFESLLEANQVAKIRLNWSDRVDGYPEILIVQAVAPTKTKVVPIGSMTHTPRRTGGDNDFDTSPGEPTDVKVAGETRLNNGVIEARVYMFAREREPDHTRVESWSNEIKTGTTERRVGPMRLQVPTYGEGPWDVAYRPPGGWKVRSATPLGKTEGIATVTDHKIVSISKPAGEVVRLFEAWVDRNDGEAGSYTKTKVYFNDITVEIEKEK